MMMMRERESDASISMLYVYVLAVHRSVYYNIYNIKYIIYIYSDIIPFSRFVIIIIIIIIFS